MDEMWNLIKCCLSVVASLGYCYFLVSKFPPGAPRLISLLPIFYLFAHLPWTFSSIQLRGTSAFFFTWLANFKLFLFSFHQGPLAGATSFLHFVSLASLPVKRYSLEERDAIRMSQAARRDLPLVMKAALLGTVIALYQYKHRLPCYAVLACCSLHIYLSLEIILALAASLARAMTGLELEPQFNEPYLSTSLQDFWGRRWNLMVSAILRPTVYHPVLRWARPVAGAGSAQLLGILAVFTVSGIMHEVMFYYLTTATPTGEVTCFFLLHGFSTAAEVAAKKAVAPFSLPSAVSTVATLAFVAGTGFWLFFPPMLRGGMDVKVMAEYQLFVDFVTDAKLSFLLH